MEYYKKTENGRTYVYVPESDRWIYSNFFNKEMRKLGLNPQEWYDFHILGISDPTYRPRCKQCGKYLKWGGVTIGYTNEFCSLSCSTKYRYSHPEEYKNFIEVQKQIYKNGSVGYMKSNPEKYKDSLESYNTFNKNGGAWGLMYKNPDNFKGYHEKMNKFYSNGGSYGYMIRHENEYKDSLTKMKDNLDKINLSGGAINMMKSNPEKYKDSLESYNTFNKNGGASRLMRDRMNEEEEYIYKCKLSKGTAYNKFKETDTCYLYVQEFDDMIKIGVSKIENAVNRRDSSIRYINNSTPPKKEFVYSGSTQDIVECEFQIKIKNYNNLYCTESTEVFKHDSLNIILDIIKSFNINFVDLTNLQS